MDIEFINENLIETTYMFCYKRVCNSHDAEDLTQEIFLEAIKMIRSGRTVERFNSWFWSMAKNRVNMFFRMKRFKAVELDGIEDFLESEEDITDNIIKQDEINDLNYTISQLSHLHREVIIMFYLKEMKIPEIARALGVPEGTVKGRLHDAKKEIEKGLKSMETNMGRGAYAPAELHLFGGYGIPDYWAEINDLMTKQIFVACAEKALTEKEISNEIGVAPVYFEQKIKYLLDNKFIKETSNGRYITNFIVYKRKTWNDFMTKLSAIFDTIGAEVTELLKEKENEIRSVGFYGNDLPFGTLLWILYCFAAEAIRDQMLSLNEDEWKGKVSADKSKKYRISGIVDYPDDDIQETMKINSVNWSNLHIHFKTSGYRIVEHANLFQTLPFADRDSIINEANVDLFMRIFDEPSISLTSNEKEFATYLIRCGYLYKKDNCLYPTMPIMTYEQRRSIFGILKTAVEPLCSKYLHLITDAAKDIILPSVRKDLLEEYAYWTLSGAFFPLGYILYYGMNSKERPLDIPDDYSKTSTAICIFIKR